MTNSVWSLEEARLALLLSLVRVWRGKKAPHEQQSSAAIASGCAHQRVACVQQRFTAKTCYSQLQINTLL